MAIYRVPRAQKPSPIFSIHTLLSEPKTNMDLDPIIKMFDHLKEKIQKVDDLVLRSLN